MRPKRIRVQAAAIGMAVVGTLLAGHFLLLDWDGRPSCHKAIDLALRIHLDEVKTGVFPT